MGALILGTIGGIFITAGVLILWLVVVCTNGVNAEGVVLRIPAVSDDYNAEDQFDNTYAWDIPKDIVEKMDYFSKDNDLELGLMNPQTIAYTFVGAGAQIFQFRDKTIRKIVENLVCSVGYKVYVNEPDKVYQELDSKDRILEFILFNLQVEAYAYPLGADKDSTYLGARVVRGTMFVPPELRTRNMLAKCTMPKFTISMTGVDPECYRGSLVGGQCLMNHNTLQRFLYKDGQILYEVRSHNVKVKLHCEIQVAAGSGFRLLDFHNDAITNLGQDRFHEIEEVALKAFMIIAGSMILEGDRRTLSTGLDLISAMYRSAVLGCNNTYSRLACTNIHSFFTMMNMVFELGPTGWALAVESTTFNKRSLDRTDRQSDHLLCYDASTCAKMGGNIAIRFDCGTNYVCIVPSWNGPHNPEDFLTKDPYTDYDWWYEACDANRHISVCKKWFSERYSAPLTTPHSMNSTNPTKPVVTVTRTKRTAATTMPKNLTNIIEFCKSMCIICFNFNNTFRKFNFNCSLCLKSEHSIVVGANTLKFKIDYDGRILDTARKVNSDRALLTYVNNYASVSSVVTYYSSIWNVDVNFTRNYASTIAWRSSLYSTDDAGLCNHDKHVDLGSPIPKFMFCIAGNMPVKNLEFLNQDLDNVNIMSTGLDHLSSESVLQITKKSKLKTVKSYNVTLTSKVLINPEAFDFTSLGAASARGCVISDFHVPAGGDITRKLYGETDVNDVLRSYENRGTRYVEGTIESMTLVKLNKVKPDVKVSYSNSFWTLNSVNCFSEQHATCQSCGFNEIYPFICNGDECKAKIPYKKIECKYHCGPDVKSLNLDPDMAFLCLQKSIRYPWYVSVFSQYDCSRSMEPYATAVHVYGLGLSLILSVSFSFLFIVISQCITTKSWKRHLSKGIGRNCLVCKTNDIKTTTEGEKHMEFCPNQTCPYCMIKFSGGIAKFNKFVRHVQSCSSKPVLKRNWENDAEINDKAKIKSNCVTRFIIRLRWRDSVGNKWLYPQVFVGIVVIIILDVLGIPSLSGCSTVPSACPGGSILDTVAGGTDKKICLLDHVFNAENLIDNLFNSAPGITGGYEDVIEDKFVKSVLYHKGNRLDALISGEVTQCDTNGNCKYTASKTYKTNPYEESTHMTAFGGKDSEHLNIYTFVGRPVHSMSLAYEYSTCDWTPYVATSYSCTDDCDGITAEKECGEFTYCHDELLRINNSVKTPRPGCPKFYSYKNEMASGYGRECGCWSIDDGCSAAVANIWPEVGEGSCGHVFNTQRSLTSSKIQIPFCVSINKKKSRCFKVRNNDVFEWDGVKFVFSIAVNKPTIPFSYMVVEWADQSTSIGLNRIYLTNVMPSYDQGGIGSIGDMKTKRNPKREWGKRCINNWNLAGAGSLNNFLKYTEDCQWEVTLPSESGWKRFLRGKYSRLGDYTGKSYGQNCEFVITEGEDIPRVNCAIDIPGVVATIEYTVSVKGRSLLLQDRNTDSDLNSIVIKSIKGYYNSETGCDMTVQFTNKGLGNIDVNCNINDTLSLRMNDIVVPSGTHTITLHLDSTIKEGEASMCCYQISGEKKDICSSTEFKFEEPLDLASNVPRHMLVSGDSLGGDIHVGGLEWFKLHWKRLLAYILIGFGTLLEVVAMLQGIKLLGRSDDTHYDDMVRGGTFREEEPDSIKYHKF